MRPALPRQRACGCWKTRSGSLIEGTVRGGLLDERVNRDYDVRLADGIDDAERQPTPTSTGQQPEEVQAVARRERTTLQLHRRNTRTCTVHSVRYSGLLIPTDRGERIPPTGA